MASDERHQILINLASYKQTVIIRSSQMQPKQFLSQSSRSGSPLKQQSKEQFFITKKNNRRMKTSACFSEPNEPPSLLESDEEIRSIFTPNKNSQFSKSELESTFGEESPDFFRVKKPAPPRRNKRIMSALSLSCNVEEVHSDSESPEKPMPRQATMPEKVPLTFSRMYALSTIDDFFLMEKIGEGSYSTVFRALHKKTGALYALKILQKSVIRQLKVEETVMREIKINLFLDHPNLAKLYHFFDDEQCIYLVCEYATDKNVYDLVNQPRLKLKKGLFSDKVSSIIGQLCEGVRFMHNHFVIHRDIKPENVLLTFDTVKLCDFGWAVFNPDKEMRSTLCGTPLYLAPELVAQQEYNQSIDIWAIGVLTYELMTQNSPFKIHKFQDLKRIVEEQVNFDRIRNKVGVDFMRKALEKDPAQRRSISELLYHPFLVK